MIMFGALFSENMWEIHWIWKTWETFRAEYENGDGVKGIYLGCLVIGYHYLAEHSED